MAEAPMSNGISLSRQCCDSNHLSPHSGLVASKAGGIREAANPRCPPPTLQNSAPSPRAHDSF